MKKSFDFGENSYEGLIFWFHYPSLQYIYILGGLDYIKLKRIYSDIMYVVNCCIFTVKTFSFQFPYLPPTAVNTSLRINDLRAEMLKNGFSAYIVPSTDPHLVTILHYTILMNYI